MKRLILLLMVALVPMLSIAQEPMALAEKYFRQGDYEKAKQIYVEYIKSDSKAEQLYAVCVECERLFLVANKYYEESLYKSSLKVCEKIMSINAHDPNVKCLQEKNNQAIQVLRDERDQMLAHARDTYSESLLESFKQKYYKQKEQVAAADKILSDIPVWKQALAENTKESYQKYMAVSEHHIYEKEAEYNIGRFLCEETWTAIVDSRNIADFEKFLASYEIYNLHCDEADAHISLLRGVKSFEEGKYISAYRSFNKADDSNLVQFQPQDLEQYRKSKDSYMFSFADTESQLRNYLKEFAADGEFIQEANSKLSIILADKLTPYSSVKQRNEVRSYAQSSYSKNYVEAVIASQKQIRKHNDRKEFGPRVTWGFLGDYEINNRIQTYSLGFRAKMGRVSNVVNMNVGVGYRFYNTLHRGSDFYGEYTQNLGGQIVIPIALRFNLFSFAKDKANVFVGCGTELGFTVGTCDMIKEGIEDNILQNFTTSFYPMIGVNMRHFDVELYYKRLDSELFNQGVVLDYTRNILDVKNMGGVKLSFYF